MTRMMRSWIVLATVAMSSSSLVACGDQGGPAATTSPGTAPTVPAATSAPATTAAVPPVFVRAQTSIAVPLGSTFGIELDSNATTGYAWEPNDEAGASVQLTGREYIAPNTSLVGAGGVERFTFEAVHVGTTQLTFEYRRSFEPATVPAVDSATFTVTVTG